jgi:hypothetical protein
MVGSKEDVETVGAFFQDLRARGLGSVTALNGEYDAWAGPMKPSNEGRLRLDLAHEALGEGHADTGSGARPRDRTRAARKAPCDRSIGRTAAIWSDSFLTCRIWMAFDRCQDLAKISAGPRGSDSTCCALRSPVPYPPSRLLRFQPLPVH